MKLTMMRIEYNEQNIILPDLRLINIFQNNSNYKGLEEMLDYYFGKKKKSKCSVKGNENHPISCNEMNYIYLENNLNMISDNLELKPKSFLNGSLEEFVKANQNDFNTLESIRNNVRNFRTDQGFYKIQKILERGLQCHCSLEFTDFPYSSILSMLSFKCDGIPEEKKLMMLYNLSIYLQRAKPLIVNLSFKIDENVLNWIYTYKDSNVYFIASVDQIDCSILPENDMLQYIILNDSESIKTEMYMPEEFDMLCYSQNSYIQKYMHLQSRNIQKIASDFSKKDKNYVCLF